MYDIVGWSAQELGDNRELINMILAWKEWLALQHFRKNASRAPNVHLDIIFLPRKHDFRRSIVPRRYITSHLRVLYPGQTKITDFQVAVLVDEDIARFQVSVHDTGGVDVFEASLQAVRTVAEQEGLQKQDNSYQDLVKKVLYELLFQRSRCQQAMEISTKEFCHEVTG